MSTTAMKPVLKTSELVISDQKIKILNNLGQVIKGIQDDISENTEKMPIYYVDASIILNYLANNKIGTIPDRVINDSLVPIDWLEEIPIVNGLPIWERLDCEPITEYRLFKRYRDIKKGDVSRRSFENLKEATGIKVKALYALSKVYHWQIRVKCYDKYRISEVEKEKEKLVTLMETTHRKAADTIFEKCVNYFKGLTKEQLAKINPKAMLDWFTEAARLTRLSLGLPADKPITKEDRTKIEKIEIGKIDSKTLNIGKPDGEKKDGYLQDVVDILDIAGVLPKKIEAKGDMQKELKEDNDNRKSK